MKLKKVFATLAVWAFISIPAFATSDDYSLAAGHTGVYINLPDIYALKCKIKTADLTEKNNKLGWYTAWPMIVDYHSKKFVQIGYITSPEQNINKPTFFVAWSDGEQINIKYLPDKKNVGNAVFPKLEHEYALSLNMDGTVNIQIDGIKYLEAEEDRINVGITRGTGEFFSEGSDLNVDISTKFTYCAYKVRGDSNWTDLHTNKDIILYHIAQGTEIESDEPNTFMVKGKIKKINKGRFVKNLKKALPKPTPSVQAQVLKQ